MPMDQSIPHFPLPEIADQNLSHTFKQQNPNDSFGSFSKRPPKLCPKPYHDVSFNKSLLNNNSIAQLISFNEETMEPSTGVLNSSIYQPEMLESYFEQCFVIISKIGEGSFGEVFKVRSKEDGRLYAVKKSKQFYRSRCHRQERLEEVKRYKQLSEHDNCVTMYKAWEEDDRLYMQMELCQSSLEAYVTQHHGLSETFVWNILLDLLLALKALHDNNLIHLDVKLDNVLIDNENVCKLADFGLVVDATKQNLHNATEGDSRYIAPELLTGRFSKAADIFSLGITTLELACNLELPKNGPLWEELRRGVLPMECIALISEELRQVVQIMMEPDPLKRPDVRTLLMFPRIQYMLTDRKKWIFIKRCRKFFKRIVEKFGQILYNLKNRIFTNILNVWSIIFAMNLTMKNSMAPPLTTPSVLLYNSYEDNPLLLLDDSEIELDGSPEKRMLHDSAMGNMLNSTPFSQHGSFRRNRKEYSRHFLVDDFHDDDDVAGNNSVNSIQHSPRLAVGSSWSNINGKSTDYLSLTAKRLVFSSEDSP